MQALRSQSKAARVFTRVAAVTGLVIIGIHYNQHQERQVSGNPFVLWYMCVA